MPPPSKVRGRRRRRRRRRRPRPPPLLVDDVIAEILLRLPPDDPAGLFRASAVCRTWRRILTDPAFSGRYRAFHRTSPVLGFLRSPFDRELGLFVLTTSFRPPAADHSDCDMLDCRHGRVLLHNRESDGLFVWDPITGDQRRLPEVPDADLLTLGRYGVALCAAGASCDHRNCRGGPFLVAFMGLGEERMARACLYSSETGAWSAQTSIELEYTELDSCISACISIEMVPTALVGDAVYFIGDFSNGILRYDLVGRGLSLIDPPYVGDFDDGIIVMPGQDGWLGFAVLNSYELCLWETDPDEPYEWVERWVIDLEMLLPVGDWRPCLSGFVDGTDVIFLNRYDGIFTMDLESLQTSKVCERDDCCCEFLYTCFYTRAYSSERLPSPVESGE